LATLAIELESHDLPPLSNLPNLSAPYFIFPLNLRSSGRGKVDNESAPSETGGKGEMTSAFGVGFEFRRRKGFAEAVLYSWWIVRQICSRVRRKMSGLWRSSYCLTGAVAYGNDVAILDDPVDQT
jgi:hypothetical protein